MNILQLRVALLITSSILGISIPASRAAVFYVSASGQDTNSGVSPALAWKTIGRANTQLLTAGDQLLFEGGSTFAGTVFVGPPESGTASNPIVVSSYGAGRATINGGNTNGFYAYNCGGLVVSNLNFAGAGRTTNLNSGIEFYSDGGGGAGKLDFVRVTSTDVGGFGDAGIQFGGGNGTNGFSDVQITHADVHDNALQGIQTYGQYQNSHTNIYVGYCRVWSNLGISNAKNNSGNGIVLGEVNNALIERCVAWTNGWIGNGSVGIWSYDSTRVTIQFCESHHNGTGGASDGDGFDLDGGSTDSVMQYNYSHDNAGAGYGIFQYSGAAVYSNNIVRYNISQNDGRKNGYGAISLWNGNGSIGVQDVDVYNNTVFMSPAPSGTASGIWFLTSVQNCHFRNNCIITTGGVGLVVAKDSQPGVLFQGNNYWPGTNTFAITWGRKTYATLAAWRTASGQEEIGVTNVGFSVEPQLANPGAGGTLGDATLLETLTAYKLKPWSPMCEAGLDLNSLFGLDTGSRDYYGNSIPNGLSFDVGANDTAIQAELTGASVEAGYLTAGYLRASPARGDLNYIPQLSSDFSAWCTNCAAPVQTNVLGEGTEQVKLSETAPAAGTAQRYLRLKVVKVP